MKRPQLIIASGKEKALLRRHPWIFSGAVKRIEGEPQEGDMVDVVDARGQWLAVGHYQNESIICKVLSFDADEAAIPVEELLRRRIHSAVNYRVVLGFFDYQTASANSQFSIFNSQLTNVFRLVHAEGDYLPGLVADWYNGVLVLQAHSVGMHRLLPVLAELFVQELQTYHGYPLKAVFDKSSATVPGGGVQDGIIWGEEIAENEVLENGIRLTVNFYEGQKTGFFIDQRENRALVQQLAAGRRLLNCFGYTGGFSLAALKGGADYVETVDISKKAIALCERNVEMNFGTDASHRGVAADVLEYLNTVEVGDYARGFDFIILDPPAFAKNHRSLQQGLKGYRSINQRAMEKIAPGGLLMTFSCSQAVSKEDFQTMVFTSAMNAGRRVRIVRQLPHAMDHPVSIHHPEGEYLKGLLLEVE
ncbi:MAG: class I SAM-dependent rRNA methyltransferase [Bacteroidales bacterium]|nr:class I SAM-dependent rRNA methyltransferase [Bacteroidales bacterium]